jgi:3-oxoacyl-[acyl-carrier protein] reductase
MTGTLQGKVCLITGSTRGIGRAIAERFAAEGGRVVVHGRSPDQVATVAAEVSATTGGTAIGLATDLRNAGAATELVRAVVDQTGRLDVLVNNAGVARDRFVTKLSDEDWEACLQVNATAPFQLLRAAVPAMKNSDSGAAVLNIVSWAGLRGNVGQAAYSASKGALYALTLSLAKELGKFGIRVNALSPMVETEMTAAMTDEMRAAAVKRVPLKRFGTLAEIAEGALFLCSDRASYTTGQVLNVDGGIHLT